MTDQYLEILNIFVSGITNVCCLYLVPVNFWWWIKLRQQDNSLKHLFLVATIIKFSIWYWTLKQILMLTTWDMTLPLTTLDNRLMFMAGVIIHVFITMHYYGVDKRTEMPNTTTTEGNQ